MKAVVFEEFGGTEKLLLRDVPVPTPAEGQVLVQVKACALNHLDLWARRGAFKVPIPMPHISGCDVCGVIAEVGKGVDHLRAGDRVIIAPGQGCGTCSECLAGRDSLCKNYRIFGFQIQGGYAEYALAEARHVIPVSRTLSYEKWAALPLVYLTAYHMLFSRAHLQPGEVVLIHACGSGVGMAAIQLARLAGAFVLTTSASDHKLQRARQELGVDGAINYERDNLAEHVDHLTQGYGVDVVIDPVGPALWEKSIDVLRRGGRLVNCAATTGMEAQLNVRSLYAKQITVAGSYMGYRSELETVIKLASAKKIDPVIDKTYRLENARSAQERMENRENFGKIVLVTDTTIS
jgi:NADPH:quinone reductase-like Zn-dependent oxidoreductase